MKKEEEIKLPFFSVYIYGTLWWISHNLLYLYYITH